jgi:hypothetical protein
VFKSIVFGILSAGLFLSTAEAGLSLYPVRQEVTLFPGSIFQGTYTVKNTFETPITMQVSYREWMTVPENKNIQTNDWLILSPTEFYMLPNEEKHVHYQIQLPTASVGFVSAMISFMPKAESAVNMMLSGSLYAIASGTEKYYWDFADVKLSYSPPTFRVDAVIQNAGNVYVRPEGMIKIYKGRKQICTGRFEEGKPVYPGTPRQIMASASRCFLTKGRYTAHLLLQDAIGNTAETKVKFKIGKNGEIIVP